MFIQRGFNISRIVTLGIMPLVVHTTIGMGQPAYSDEIDQKSTETISEIVSATAEQEPSELIEEIVVYGDKSLPALRLEVYRTEENFFDVFSSVNQDDEYDVRCFYEVPSFTHIRRHVCRANFVTKATSDGAAVFMGADPRILRVPAGTIILQKKRQMQEIIELLVAEHPELMQALSEYTDAKAIYESEKKRR